MQEGQQYAYSAPLYLFDSIVTQMRNVRRRRAFQTLEWRTAFVTSLALLNHGPVVHRGHNIRWSGMSDDCQSRCVSKAC